MAMWLETENSDLALPFAAQLNKLFNLKLDPSSLTRDSLSGQLIGFLEMKDLLSEQERKKAILVIFLALHA